MKFLFFVDLIHYSLQQQLLLGDRYIRMPFGPADAVALSITADSNQYLCVTIPPAPSGRMQSIVLPYHVQPEVRPPRRKTSRKERNYPQDRALIEFTTNIPADQGLFSAYELALFDMVLRVLERMRATEVSDLTHKLRLWSEFSDGETIPLEYFDLKDEETRMLESSGFIFSGFHRTFANTMLPLSRAVGGSPETKHSMPVAGVLDRLVGCYPLPDLEIFYDAYLSWDDCFREALIARPSYVPDLAADCSESLALVTYALHQHEQYADKIAVFSRDKEKEYNRIYKSLRSESSPDTESVECTGYVDRVMALSREMADRTRPEGR